jgi:hypothetical protein
MVGGWDGVDGLIAVLYCCCSLGWCATVCAAIRGGVEYRVLWGRVVVLSVPACRCVSIPIHASIVADSVSGAGDSFVYAIGFVIRCGRAKSSS